jgi:methylated-DNA-[protein]-cysteine S-methyltransferase
MSVVRHTVIESGLGELTLVADGDTLTGLYFPQHWYPPVDDAIGPFVEAGSDPVFTATATELAEYLDGSRIRFDVPIATTGSPFQEQVWALLRQIPFGETRTYAELGGMLGDRRLARKVGQAVGRNPVSVIIGCHRVVATNGGLAGYAGGLERKRQLLDHEQAATALVGAGRA